MSFITWFWFWFWFCKASSVMVSSLLQRITEDFSILDLVLLLRRQRPSAVQTKVGLHVGSGQQHLPAGSLRFHDADPSPAVSPGPARSRAGQPGLGVGPGLKAADPSPEHDSTSTSRGDPGSVSDCGCVSRTSMGSSSARPPACWSASCRRLRTGSTATCRR